MTHALDLASGARRCPETLGRNARCAELSSGLEGSGVVLDGDERAVEKTERNRRK
ncbi:MAG: hypothetical protein GXP52_03035 [Deltaproteobacteria bacterium]|nr:hypothetical protein [Deltaproteobacteria bacterium]